MEQKTEASQAVDEPMRQAFWRFIATLPTPVQDNISTSEERGESITAKAFESGYHAALKAQPAPTEAAQGEDSARLDWLLPNLHPADFGFDFDGGYEWKSREELLRKFRTAIDRARASAETGGVKS